MTHKLMTRRLSSVTILEVSGELTLHDEVLQVMATGSLWILLNITRMNRIDSFGIGELVSAYASIVRAGGQMKLLSVPLQVKRVLEITGLCAVFEMYEDEASAVRSFSGAQPLRPVAKRAKPGSEIYLG